MLYDSVYMKCPKWTDLYRQQVDKELPRCGGWGKWGRLLVGVGGLLEVTKMFES